MLKDYFKKRLKKSKAKALVSSKEETFTNPRTIEWTGSVVAIDTSWSYSSSEISLSSSSDVTSSMKHYPVQKHRSTRKKRDEALELLYAIWKMNMKKEHQAENRWGTSVPEMCWRGEKRWTGPPHSPFHSIQYTDILVGARNCQFSIQVPDETQKLCIWKFSRMPTIIYSQTVKKNSIIGAKTISYFAWIR